MLVHKVMVNRKLSRKTDFTKITMVFISHVEGMMSKKQVNQIPRLLHFYRQSLNK